MAFTNTVLAEVQDLPAGEVIKSLPHDVQAFDDFEEGLPVGRFCKFDSGQIKIVDGTATPKIMGIVKRKVTGEIQSAGTYTKTGLGADSVAEVILYGYATVAVASGATPSRYKQVNVINADANAENGMATDASVTTGIVAAGTAGDVVFWEAKAPGVWLVRFNKYSLGV